MIIGDSASVSAACVVYLYHRNLRVALRCVVLTELVVNVRGAHNDVLIKRSWSLCYRQPMVRQMRASRERIERWDKQDQTQLEPAARHVIPSRAWVISMTKFASIDQPT